MTTDSSHLRYMRRALELAARGLGRTSPNPAVGAVVVADDKIVGEGFHHAAGQPHAERIALEAVGQQATGAELYVTLEPCSTPGRTPPCTEAIITAGIKRVVYACRDCDEHNAGRADQVLAAAGIETICGPLERQARQLNEAYFKHNPTGQPFVTVKLACTLDGKIATRTGDSMWITGQKARQFVHKLRDRSDAVIVGIDTVLADNPALTTRLERPDCRDALRVIVDSAADTPAEAKVVAGPSLVPCLIATSRQKIQKKEAQQRAMQLQEAGAEILELPQQESGKVDLEALMQELGSRDIMSVLVEGGAHLVGSLLRDGLVDKFLLFYAPRIVGDQEALSAITGLDTQSISNARSVQIHRIEQFDEDILVTAYPCSPD